MQPGGGRTSAGATVRFPGFGEAGFRVVGRRSYRLRFRVPRITPGVYAFVICNCPPGRRGTLVVNTSQPANLLLVRSEQNPVASKGSGTDAPWFVAAAAVVAAIAGGAVLLRRHRAQR